MANGLMRPELSLSTMSGHSKKATVQTRRKILTRNQTYWHLNFGLFSLQDLKK